MSSRMIFKASQIKAYVSDHTDPGAFICLLYDHPFQKKISPRSYNSDHFSLNIYFAIYKYTLFLRIMYLYCVYPEISESPNYLKRAEAIVFLIIFNDILHHVRIYDVIGSYHSPKA
jgi:hypothetical protein